MLNLDKKNRYLLACSYGPDSMALCKMLLNEGYCFDVAHVNYHLREESNQEEQDLRKFCERNSLKLFVHDNQIKLIKNVEAECRKIRYAFFKKIYDSKSYAGLLVAHNEDDKIETYLLQKMRKNLVKCYGIADNTEINKMIVLRPILAWTKSDLTKFCDDNKVPYSIDKTNLIPIYERNKIRINLVSKMTRTERDELLREIDGKNRELKAMFSKLSKQTNDIKSLRSLSDIVFAYWINTQIEKINPIYKITYKQSREIVDMMCSIKPNSYMICERGKVIIEKCYDKLIVRSNNEFNGYSFVMKKPGILDNEFFYADFTGDTSNRNVLCLDYALTIRTYQKGDKYKIKDYEVPVRRLFIDWKMPMYLRKRWPIIVNKEGKIIYIPRYRKDFVIPKNCNFYVKECFTFQ